MLVPAPTRNGRYHGILAPNAKHRSAVLPNPSRQNRRRRTRAHAPVQALGGVRQDDPAAPTAPMTWMERLLRVFVIDLSICPDCGGRLRVIADVPDQASFKESERPAQRYSARFTNRWWFMLLILLCIGLAPSTLLLRLFLLDDIREHIRLPNV